jgi:hypothetical protein
MQAPHIESVAIGTLGENVGDGGRRRSIELLRTNAVTHRKGYQDGNNGVERQAHSELLSSRSSSHGRRMGVVRVLFAGCKNWVNGAQGD